ncbi:EAL domain-containing protein [Thauera terpenica]|uniref:EAL domain-containing protein n=1 Tax=Thauera terpenica TaxID=76113 RepID=UPI001FDF3B5D|nr:EAL domain-containing protein [Thauera terpenica]
MAKDVLQDDYWTHLMNNDSPERRSASSPSGDASPGCDRCRDLVPLDFEFSMAFQPIVDITQRTVWGWEALVRGIEGEGAASILARVNDGNRYQFDQKCRVRAIELAQKLSLPSRLSINFLPNAVYDPRSCMRVTTEAANRVGFPLERLQFEITEVEQVRDDGHLRDIVNEYRAMGCGTAIDDFGAGYSGLNLLTHFQPDVLKIDMNLIRDIDQDRTRRLIVHNLVQLAADLPCTLIAEGIETINEARCLADLGIRLHQGYAYARPGFETLPQPDPTLLAHVHSC